jgi:hypothetical protein
VNRERHKYWSAYIADLQGRMRLGQWDIELVRKPAEDGASASMSDVPGRHRACIWLCKDFDSSYTRYEQRNAVVHELVHLHLAPLEYHLEVQNGKVDEEAEERQRIHKGHRSHEEYAVDDLTRIIAPSMPMPSKVRA